MISEESALAYCPSIFPIGMGNENVPDVLSLLKFPPAPVIADFALAMISSAEVENGTENLQLIVFN